MGTSPQNHERSFDLAGPAGPVRIDLSGPLISIAGGKKNVSISEENLIRISHHPGSWRFGSSRPGLWVRFEYRDGWSEKKTEIALFGDNPATLDFLHYLDGRFPARSCLGPNKQEKNRVLSKGWRGSYGLHALIVLTPAGIFLAMFLISVLLLSIILAEGMPTRVLNNEALELARLVFLGLALIVAALIALIAAKKLMVLRTDFEGLTIRRIFRRRTLWREFEIGEPRSDCFNVYTGIACWYSGTIDVVASRGIVEIPLLRGGKVISTLKLNLEEAGPLFRELYYRGKVNLETARKIGAFI